MILNTRSELQKQGFPKERCILQQETCIFLQKNALPAEKCLFLQKMHFPAEKCGVWRHQTRKPTSPSEMDKVLPSW